MNAETFLRLSQYRTFWRLRAYAAKQRFRLLSQAFRARYLARDERANASILISFLGLTFLQLLLAIAITSVLELIELALVPELVDRWPIPDSSNYVSWLSTTAQIGGVFIALYFSAVTAAAGAIYAQVPNNVRDLLARERVGNTYIRYLTLATFIPLCLIALHLAGLEPLRLAVPLLLVITGIGIIAFAALGRRAFNLFDPTRLAGSLFWDMGRWLSQVSAGVEKLLEVGATLSAWSGRLVEGSRVWQSAAVLSRYQEYLSKLDYHVPYFISQAKKLQLAKHLTDLQWPDLKPEAWTDALRTQNLEAAPLIANHIILLMQSKQPQDVPDYRGQFVHTTGESLFNALEGRQADAANALLKPYLAGSFSLFNELCPSGNQSLDVWTEQKLQIAAAPVIDVLELSGYAKLFAELYAVEEIWTAVWSVWDSILQTNVVSLTWLAAIMTGGIPRFQMPHRGLIRTNWSMRVQHELDKLPRHNTIRGGLGGIFASGSVVHARALVRYCANHHFHNGKDIFAALCLSELEGGRELEWGHGVRDLKNSLEREEERYQGDDEEEDAGEEGNELQE